MDQLGAYSQYLELIAALLGTLRYRQLCGSKLKFVLFFLWYVVFTDFFSGICYPYFGIPNYIPYNIYYYVNFAFFLWWFRSLISNRPRRSFLGFLLVVFSVFYVMNALFLQDFVFKFLTFSFTLGTVCIVLAVGAYFAEMLERDVVLNVTASPYFWVAFGLLVFCVTYLPFKIAYEFMEKERSQINGFVLFCINLIQYSCFAVAFLKMGRNNVEHNI